MRFDMADTSIEWTDATWNPVSGCSIVSPGCTNCYAMRMAARLEAMGSAKYFGLTRRSGGRAVWTGKIRLDSDSLEAPIKWNRPRRVFVNSMSDLFHPDVPLEFIRQIWKVMECAERHTFQILTKRPDRMARLSKTLRVLPNVWLGTSVENGDYIGRLDDLRCAKATIRFVSFEPLLGPVGQADLSNIDWAIVGGESGPRARPMDAQWVDQIRASCGRTGTAFFFKQWGGRNKAKTGRSLHGRTWDEFPAVTCSEGDQRCEMRL
jgi:protein gp37